MGCSPRHWLKFLVSLLLSFSLLLLVLPRVAARDDIGLRSEIIHLRSRIERLEIQVSRLSSQTRSSPAAPSPSGSGVGVVDGVPVGRTDPMFERLATLLIELKERVGDLEKRMDRWEGSQR